MSDRIERIPEKTRWEMATKGLTGEYIAISNALKLAVGQKKFEEFNGPLWYEAGKGAKEFANTLGLPTENANSFAPLPASYRSEEHTSELQSHVNLVCRLLLEKKKK